MVMRYYILMMFFLLSLSISGQNLLSYVTVNNTNPYVGQPVQVKVYVYTTTFFTAGINVGNIQVDNALTVYFRSVSGVKNINGKKYAGVEFYYDLFPTREGSITIPSLEIQVETPKEGGYKGIKRILKTKPKNITAKSIPLGYDPQKWLVANSLSVNQQWSIPLSNIKVGDVVQRTINRSARGTLSEFIPATQWDSIAGVSLYPKRAKVTSNKSRTSISSSRLETVRYLFEKEGKVVIPKMTYMYWNNQNKKYYQKQVDSVVVEVKPNPDLTMLSSIKKSLQKENQEENAEVETPFLIFGLEPKTFVKYLLIGLFVFVVFLKMVTFTASFLRKFFNDYLASEKYAFKQLIKAIDVYDYESYSTKSRVWLMKLGNPYPTIGQLVQNYGNNEFINIFNTTNEVLFKYEKKNEKNSAAAMKNGLKYIRKLYLKNIQIKQETALINKDWLNPKKL